MKSCLIIPAWRPEDIFSSKTVESQINYWQPLGTLYVASAMEAAGHSVRFLNGAFMNHYEIIRQVSEEGCHFVGIYSTAFGWPRARKTAEAVRAVLPDAYIVAGGPYPVAVREESLSDCKAMDAVVTGEGEDTVVELMERLGKGRPLHDVEGLVFRGRDGRIVVNPPRPFITDLDRVPIPARHLLGEADRYVPPPGTYRRKPVAVMMTSRGCNRRCLYCFQMDRSRNSGIRYRGLEKVMEEIELCLAQGYREIKFIDDTLAADYDRAMAFTEKIRNRKLRFSWFASACANQVDETLLRAFRKAGCWAVLIGAESGVQKNLNTIRKGVTLQQIERAVGAAKSAGLQVFTPFIIGLPGETWENALQTIEFACRLNPHFANFHALTPFPGTELYDQAERYGTLSNDLNDYTYQGAAFTPYTLTREQILELRQTAFRRFYSRPSFLLRRVAAIRTGRDLVTAWKGLKSLARLWGAAGSVRRSPSTG